MPETNRIVCVETKHAHRHILAVGIGSNPDKATERKTVEEVRRNIADGEMFFTVGSHSGETAWVSPEDCNIGDCVVPTIRTHPDDAKDDNLDEMRACRFSKS